MIASAAVMDISSGTVSTFRLDKSCDEPLTIKNDTSSSTTILVGPNVKAELDFSKLSGEVNLVLEAGSEISVFQHGAPQRLSAQVHNDAHVRILEFNLSQESIERTTTVLLLKPGAQVSYFGLDILHGNAYKNTALTIYHRAPHTKSRQELRGIYGGLCQANFLGKVVVEACAPKTSAAQLYKAILLGKQAKAQAKPELEIYNHDVKASHGASFGTFDKQALFYLCSRGVSERNAKGLLIAAVANEILGSLHEEMPKRKIAGLVEEAVAMVSGGDV